MCESRCVQRPEVSEALAELGNGALVIAAMLEDESVFISYRNFEREFISRETCEKLAMACGRRKQGFEPSTGCRHINGLL
jgi:hypothetical protein